MRIGLIRRPLYPVVLASMAIVAACGQDAASVAPAPPAARASEAAPAVPERQPEVAPPPEVIPVAETRGGVEVAPLSLTAEGLVFTDVRTQAREFIGYYRSIKLTLEQERMKVEALAALPAPCCSEYTMATCCCPCNMAKSVWGMSAWLITEKGYGVEQVRHAAVDWIAFINPDGFSGTACSKGGCRRPFEHDGCGGMNESDLL